MCGGFGGGGERGAAEGWVIVDGCDGDMAARQKFVGVISSRRPVPTWRIATFWRYALKGLGPCPMDPLPYDGV